MNAAISYAHISEEACRSLWAARIVVMANDANGAVAGGTSAPQAKRILVARAQNWFADNGRDFRATCLAAGFDPDWIRDAYLAGKLTPKRMQKMRGQHMREGLD